MGNILVINSVLPEVRVALLENGILTELYVERKREQGSVGNIYRGRIVRVVPGLEATFVDIGQEKAAFLYMADSRSPGDNNSTELEEEMTASTPAQAAVTAHRTRSCRDLRSPLVMCYGSLIYIFTMRWDGANT